MKKVSLAFLTCLLIAASLSSCDRINSLFEKSSTSSYQIDVSEGRTEVEKTLIIQYNNLMYALIPLAERVKKGKGEISASTVKESDVFKLDMFLSVVIGQVQTNHTLPDVDNKLLQQMLKNIENILSSTGNENFQETASHCRKLRKMLSDGFSASDF